MHRTRLTRRILTALAALAALFGALAESASTLVYPPAPRTNQVDDYHGHRIADPYRTLEDPDNPATRAWIEAEAKLTSQWLAAIPQRDTIKRRLTQLFDYERYPASTLANFSHGFIWSYAGAFSAGNHYFLLRNSGLQNQAVLYRVDAQGNHPQVLLDPNTFRSDGTAALCGLASSRDGSLLAFGLAQAGSDWCEWRIRNVESGQDLPEVLQWTKDAAPAWTADDRAFYYVRYPQPPEGQILTAVNRNPKVMLHRIGEAADRDRFVYEDPAHADSGFGPVLTADGRWLVVHMDLPQDSSRNMLYFEDLSAAGTHMTLLTPDPKGIYDYAGSQGSRIYVRTTDGAPKGRIIAIDLSQPGREHWAEVVAEQPDSLEHAALASGRLLLSYLHNAHARAVLYSLAAKTTSEVAFDGIGSANWSPAQPDSNELFYSFVTFTSPASLYRLDLRTGRTTLLRRSKLSFDAGQYQTEQVFYPSKDGTRVPMFLVHRKGMRARRQEPDHPIWLRRVQPCPHAVVQPGHDCMAGNGRCVGGAEPARRLRIWRSLAPGRRAAQQAERVRRFHRGRRMADPQPLHVDAQAGDFRRQQRRPAGGRLPEPAPRLVRRGHARRRRDGHAALPQVHRRRRVGGRVWVAGQSGRFQNAAGLLAAAQHPQDQLSRHADHHFRS